MTNNRAREIVDQWLSDLGRSTPWEGHNYIDYVTEVRILSGIDPQQDAFDVWDREDACQWLRVLARRIVDDVPIGKTLMALETRH